MWLLRSSEENHSGNEAAEGQTIIELKEQFEQQQQLIEQLKTMLRENEQKLGKSEHDLEESRQKLSKLRLQHKANLNQLKESRSNNSSPDHHAGNSESSSDSSTAGQNRGRVILLKKQLDENKAFFEKREKEMSERHHNIEQVAASLQSQLEESKRVISELSQANVNNGKGQETNGGSNNSGKVGFDELYAQTVYKDVKIMELDNKILELERSIMDLQENLREKDEIISAKNQSIYLMTEDLSRRGKVVVDQLDDTRDQMKIMQENFATIESEWNGEKTLFMSEIQSLKDQHERVVSDNNNRLKQMEETISNLETTRFDLSSRNAQLQEKIVHLQEKLGRDQKIENNDYEARCKELQEELAALKSDLEKKDSAKLEHSNIKRGGSDQKWLKMKAQMTRQIKELESQKSEDADKFSKLQLRISAVEQEKKELKLRLIDLEEAASAQSQLAKIIDDLSLKIRQQNDDLDEHVKAFSSLESTKLDLADQNLKLRTSLEESHGRNSTLDEELQQLKYEHINLENQIRQLEELRSDLEKVNHSNVVNEKEQLKSAAEWEMKSKLWLQTEEDLNEQIAIVQSDFRELKKTNNKLCDTLNEKSQDYDKLIEEFSELEAHAKSKEREWKVEKDQLNGVIQKLESSVAQNEEAKSTYSKRVQQLSHDLTQKSELLDDFKQQLAMTEIEVEKWKTVNAEYNSHLITSQKKQEISEAQISQLEKGVLETEEDFERIITEKDQMLEDFKHNLRLVNEEFQTKEESLLSNISILKEELLAVKSECSSYQDILTDKNNKFQEMSSQMSTQETTNVQMADDIQSYQSAIGVLNDTVNELQLKLQEKVEEFTVLNEVYERSQHQVNILDEKGEHQEQDLSALRAQLLNCENAKVQLESELKSISDNHGVRVKDMEIKINELIVERDELAERERRVASELKRLEAESQLLMRTKQELDAALESRVEAHKQELLQADFVRNDMISELEASKFKVEQLEIELKDHLSVLDLLSNSKVELEAAKSEAHDVLMANSQLKEDLVSAHNAADDLRATITSLEQTRDELKSYIGVSDLLNATEKQLEESLDKNRELAKNAEVLVKELEVSKKAEERLQEAVRDHAEVSNLLSETRQQLEAAILENRELLTLNSRLKEELENAGNITNELKESYVSLEKLQEQSFGKNEELSQLNADLKVSAEGLALELEAIKQDSERLQAELKHTLDSFHETKANFEAVVIEKQQLLELNVTLKEDLEISEKDAKNFKQLNVDTVEKIQEELNNQINVLRDTEKQLEATLKEKQELLSLNCELTEELNAVRKSVYDLQTSNSNLVGVSERISETEKELEVAVSKNQELVALNSEMERKLQSAEAEATEREKLKTDVETLLEELKNCNDKSRKQLETTMNEKHELLTLNSGLKDELDDAREMVDKLNSEGETTSEKNSELLRLVEEYTDEISRLDLELQYRQNIIFTQEKEIGDLNNRVDSLNAANASVSEEKQAKEAENENLKRSVEQLQFFETAFKDCSENIGSLESEMGTRRAEEEKLKEQNKRLMEYTQQLEADLNNVSENSRVLEEETEKLNLDMAQLRQERDRTEEISRTSETFIEQLKSQLSDVTGNFDGACKRELEVQELCKSLENERDVLQRQLEEVQVLRYESENSIVALREEFSSKMQQIETEKGDVEKQRDDLELKLVSDREAFELKSKNLTDQVEILKGDSSDEIRLLTEKLTEVMRDAETQQLALKAEIKTQESVVNQLNESLRALDVGVNKLRALVDENAEECDFEKIVDYSVSLVDRLRRENADLVQLTERQRLEFQEHSLNLEALTVRENDLKLELDEYKLKFAERAAVMDQNGEDIKNLTGKTFELETLNSRFLEQISHHQVVIEDLQTRLEENETELIKRAREMNDFQSRLKSCLPHEESNNLPADDLNKLIETIRDSGEVNREQVNILRTKLTEIETQKNLLVQEHEQCINKLEEDDGRSKMEQSEVNELRLIVSSLNDQINDLSKQGEDSAELHRRLTEKEELIKQIQEDINHFTASLSRMNDGDVDYFPENSSFQTNPLFSSVIRLLDGANSTFKDETARLGENVKQIQNELDISENQRTILADQVKALTVNLENEHRSLNELSSEFERQGRDYRADVDRLTTEKCMLDERLQAINEELKPKTVEISPVVDGVKMVDEQLLGSPSELVGTERAESPQEMKKTMAVLKIKNEKMMTRLKMFKDKNDRLQIQLNEIMTDRSRLEDESKRLNGHNQRSKDELHRLSVELRNVDRLWKSETQQLQDRLDTVETANSKLVDIKEDLERRLMTEMKLKSDLSSEKERLEQSNTVCGDLQERCNELERKLNNEREHNQFLENDIRQYQDLTEKLKSENKSLETQAEQTKTSVSESDELREEINRLNSLHEETVREHVTQQKIYSIEMEDVQQRLALAVQAKELLQKQLDEFREILVSNCEEQPDSGDETGDLGLLLKSLIVRSDSLSQELQILRSELQVNLTKLDEVEDLRRQFSVLQDQVADLRTENAQFVEETAKSSGELNKVVSYNAELVQNLQELQTALESANAERMTMELNMSEAVKQQDELMKNVENETSLEHNRHLQTQADLYDLRTSFDSLRGLNENLAAEAVSLRNENDSLRIEMDKMNSIDKMNSKREEHSYVNLSNYSLRASDDEISQVQAELQMAVSSLHSKDLRCEELTDEITELLKERDSLQIRLSMLLRADQQKEVKIQKIERELLLRSPSPVHTYINLEETVHANENFTSQDELAARLADCDKRRQELLELNASLTESLTIERDSRMKLSADLKMLEAELESRWKRKTKTRHETKLEFEDMKTPLLAENPQIIERTYTGTTWRIMNWIQGRSVPRVMHV